MTGTFFIMLACFTWALDTLIRYPLLEQGYSTLQIVLLEHLTLALVTAPIAWRLRHAFRNMSLKSYAVLFFIGGIGSALGTLAFTQAFHYLNPTVVILLQKLQPIVAITVAFIVLDEKINRTFVQWLLVILAGSLIMIWPDIMSLNQASLYYSDNLNFILKGYGLTLLAVVAWGCATVCGKYLARNEVPADAIMSGRFITGLIVLAVLALQNNEQVFTVQPYDLFKVVVMALLSGLLGMWLYYRGLVRIPAQFATLAEMTFPVFAAAINWLVLGMSLSTFQVVGAVLLLVGNIGLRLKEFAYSQQVTA